MIVDRRHGRSLFSAAVLWCGVVLGVFMGGDQILAKRPLFEGVFSFFGSLSRIRAPAQERVVKASSG
jgi:hypothetical protein